MCARVTSPGHVLLIEPFNGGSHKQLVDLLCKDVPGIVPVTLPGKKWHWKARVSALYMSQIIPRSKDYQILFASSVLSLCELVSLRPDLSPLKKVLYFHENQLMYPKQKEMDRDYQYGYNNITSCMVADTVLFNSKYNMESFLRTVDSFLNKIPYEKPKGISDEIRRKCHVLNFPIVFPKIDDIRDSIVRMDRESTSTMYKALRDNCEELSQTGDLNDGMLRDTLSPDDNITVTPSLQVWGPFNRLSQEMDTVNPLPNNNGILRVVEDYLRNHCGKSESHSTDITDDTQTRDHHSKKGLKPLSIVWPHRWEHDKNPAMMFRVINRLVEVGCDFRLSVLGESYTEYPDVFVENKVRLKDKIDHWGFVESKLKYYQILYNADCVISTADHEFFGVAMLEAVHLGCFPLCPNRLVYPEIFPKECLYNTETQLYKRLRECCRKPYLLRQNKFKFNTEQYSWDTLKPQYMKYLTAQCDWV